MKNYNEADLIDIVADIMINDSVISTICDKDLTVKLAIMEFAIVFLNRILGERWMYDE